MAVVISGLSEVVRGFNKVNRATSREIQAGLKKAAEPVTASAREKVSRYPGASAGTIRPRARSASVYVTQNARKVTGLRGDFGSLQQRRLDEALHENESQVERGVQDAIDRLVDMF